jgi:hypothetical protein
MSERLTVICTTVARPRCAETFLRSLRASMPDVPVVLGEQAETPVLGDLCAELHAGHLHLPFDCGVSRARNALVGAISTDYFLLTEEDFRFEAAPDVGYCMRFLDANPQFLGVTGALQDLRAKPTTGRVAHNFAFDTAGCGLIVLSIDIIRTRGTQFEGSTVRHCHMGPNWGVFRRSMFAGLGLHWDEDFKIGGEHIDFYLRLARRFPDILLGFSERLVCQHVDDDDPGYEDLRNRRDWLEMFRSKWPFRYRYDLGGVLRMFETYDKPEPVPNPSADRWRNLYREQRDEAARLARKLAAATRET